MRRNTAASAAGARPNRVYAARSNPPPPDEWNLLPDPTTGQVDVYHKGGYVGSVTGNEPADQDPPVPHPVAPAKRTERSYSFRSCAR